MAKRRAPVRRDARVAAALSALLAAAPASGACPPQPADGHRADGADVSLAWRVDGLEAVPLAEPFALVITLCPAAVELLAVDATMPAHRHGMNYRPSVQRRADGRWRAQGLLWHMRGDWALQWTVRVEGRLVTLSQTVTLP